MKRLLLLFLFLSVFVSGQALSQDNDTIKRKTFWDVVDTTGYTDHQKRIALFLRNVPLRTREETDKEAMEKLHLSFTPNDEFTMTFEGGSFKSMTDGCGETRDHLSPKLCSKDSNFIAYFDLQPLFYPDLPRDTTCWTYFEQAKFDIAVYLNTSYENLTQQEFEAHLYRYPDEYAKKMFNADFGYYYYLDNLNEDELFKKYRKGKVLHIEKSKYGYFALYCFYTEEGYKNIQKYESELEKCIEFEN
jgi:hypothetical protein